MVDSDDEEQVLKKKEQDDQIMQGAVHDEIVEEELDPLKRLVDVSIRKDKTMMKQIRKEGTGRDGPREGAMVKVYVKAVDGQGNPLLQDRMISFPAASGYHCEALDEAVLLMKKGEVAEIRCTCPVCDKELGLLTDGRGEVMLGLYLIDFEHDVGLDEYGLARLAHCIQRKDAGTVFFKKELWMTALKRYSYVAQVLSPLEYFEDADVRARATEQKRICYLNAAQCWLKMGSWRDAADLCKTVLEEDPSNLKALYRRAQALRELAQYREAEEHLTRLLESDAENREAQKLLALVRQDEKKGMAQLGRNLVKSAADTEDRSNQAKAPLKLDPLAEAMKGFYMTPDTEMAPATEE